MLHHILKFTYLFWLFYQCVFVGVLHRYELPRIFTCLNMHQDNNSGLRYLESFCFDFSYTSSPYKLMCIHSNIWRWTVCCGGPVTVLVWNRLF